MSTSDVQPGLTGTVSYKVLPSHTAQALGSGSVAVFATPQLVALMEAAAVKALEGRLAEKMTTVGTMISVNHTAATPVGMTVSATATLKAVNGKKYEFSVEARDDKEVIGTAEHHRFLVDETKFLDRATAKLASSM